MKSVKVWLRLSLLKSLKVIWRNIDLDKIMLKNKNINKNISSHKARKTKIFVEKSGAVRIINMEGKIY